MKYLFGFLLALLLMLVQQFLNEFILVYKIPEFLMGWISAMGYYFIVDYFTNIQTRKN